MKRKKQKFPLDRTLRYIICSLRIGEDPLVAIEFVHNGKHWRVDTVEEAIALRRRLELEDQEGDIWPVEAIQSEKNKWTPDRFVELIDKVSDSQQENFIRVLMNAGEQAISADEVAEKLKLDSLMALAGIQSGLSKQLRGMGLEPTDLYQGWIDWTGRERVRFLRLNRDFRIAAELAGWPPATHEKKTK